MFGPATLRGMATAARELGDADWALELNAVATKGGKESVRLCVAVVRVLAKTGRLDEAAPVLQVIYL